MSQRLEHFDVSVDGNGETLEYLTFAGGDGTVLAITVHFPSGCADLVGAQVFYSDIQVIPKTASGFLRGNAQVHRLEIASFPTGSSWAVFLDSTDLYPHTLRFDFEIDEIAIAGPQGFGFPPIVLVPLDVSMVGSLEQVTDDGGVIIPTGIGLPPGLHGGGGGGSGSQAELDSLRVAILSATSDQQRADMQARINELVAMGYH